MKLSPLKFGNKPTQIIAPISELKNAPPVTNKPGRGARATK